MKKLMMIAAMAVATLSANAQTEPGTFSIIPRIGGTGSLFTKAPQPGFAVPGDFDKSARGGNFTGVDFEYRIAKQFSMSAGVNFSDQGMEWKELKINNSKIKDVKIETSYVNLPITANFYLTRGLALKTGVQFGFLVNAHSKYSVENKTGDTKVTSTTDTKCKDAFNKFDVSIPVGISYEFKVPIVLDLRYNIGLSKVGKKGTPFEDCRNGSLALTVGYKFNL